MGPDDSVEIPKIDIVKSLIDDAGSKASERRNVSTNELEEVRKNRCKTVNSHIAHHLNEAGYPSITYSLHPDRTNNEQRFVNSRWVSHYIGVVKLGENDYLAFDQTNFQNKDQTSPPYFYIRGDLSYLTQALEHRFGSQWGLDWTGGNTQVAPEKTVKGKLEMIEASIQNNKAPESPQISYTIPPEIEKSPIWDKVRAQFTDNRL